MAKHVSNSTTARNTPGPFYYHHLHHSPAYISRQRCFDKSPSYICNCKLSALVNTVTKSTMATKPTIKVAAICGSLRKASYNGGLLRSAVELSESIDGMTIECLDISSLPMLNTDLEVDGKCPPVVEEFRQKILQSDCFLFASPEYNYSVTAPLKNAIDWASRPPNAWGNKPAAIISAGGGFGGGRSHYHLRQIGVFIDLHFINKPEFVLNAFQPPAKFDNDGNLIDPEAKERLKLVLLSLKDFTLRLQQGN